MSVTVPTTPNPLGTYSRAGSGSSGIPACVATVYGRAFVPSTVEMVRTWTGIADTGYVTVPRTDDVDWSTFLASPTSDEGAVVAEIFCGWPSAPRAPGSTDTSQLTSRFYGIVVPDYTCKASANEVTFKLASMAVLLQVDRMVKLSQNQTTLDFVKACAATVPGLQVVADLGSQPALPMRAVLGRDFVVGVHSYKPWDMMMACAEADDAVLSVRGRTLYYLSPDAFAGPTLALAYGRDLIDWEGSHAPQYNRNIEVEVRTWAPQTSYSYRTVATTGVGGAVVTKTVGRTSITIPEFGSPFATTTTTSGGATSTVTRSKSGGLFSTGFASIPRDSSKDRYIFHVPNLSKDEADQLRDQIYRRLSRTEYTCTYEFPVTPANFAAVGDMTALHVLSNLPLARFNSGGVNTPGYHQRRTTERIENDGTGNGGGWHVMCESVNYSPPQGGGF